MVEDELRKAIAESGLTPAEISRIAGVNKSTVTRLVRQERSAGLDVAERIAAAIGMELVIRPKRTRKG